MTNMKHSFPELENLKQRLTKQVESLNVQLAALEKQLDSVETTLVLLKQEQAFGPASQQIGTIFPNELRGLTQLDAMIKIAKSNNNRIKLVTAKELLLRAGVTKSRKNANNIIFNVIKRSQRFKRISPGEYELIESDVGGILPKTQELEAVARTAALPLSNPV
jgi:hypothetical protein